MLPPSGWRAGSRARPGFLVGPSSGANVHAACEIAKRFKDGGKVVTVLCDSGERYLF